MSHGYLPPSLTDRIRRVETPETLNCTQHGVCQTFEVLACWYEPSGNPEGTADASLGSTLQAFISHTNDRTYELGCEWGLRDPIIWSQRQIYSVDAESGGMDMIITAAIFTLIPQAKEFRSLVDATLLLGSTRLACKLARNG